MPVKKFSEMDEIGAAPASGDQIVVLDVSDTTESAQGTLKRINASRVALTGAANTFAPTAGTTSIIVNQPLAESSVSGVQLQNNGVAAINLFALAGATEIGASRRNLGNNIPGTSLYLAQNSNAGANGPAAAHIRIESVSGQRVFWADGSGNLRVHSAAPTGSAGSPTVADTAGTVVGTQTSWHGAKENIEEWDGAEALDAIRAMTLYSYQMLEDGQQTPEGEKPTYRGIVIMDEDRESNAWFGLGYGDQQVPALNDRNLFGYMLAAIRHGGNIINELQDQVAALTARVEALEGAE